MTLKNPYLLLFTCLLLLFSTPGLSQENDLNLIQKNIRLRQYNQAVDLLKPLLRQNNARAEFIMAGLYRSGKGVDKNLDKAQWYYTKAAEHGLDKAQYALATLLSKQSPNKTSERILYWYQQAAKQGHTGAKKQLKRLQKQSTSKNTTITAERIFSHIRTNNSDAIEHIIQSKVSLNVRDSNNRSPLQVALISQRHDLSKRLLDVTPIAEIRRYTKDLPLHLAIANGFDDIAQTLIQQNINIHSKDAQGNNALFIATRHNNQSITKQLLEHGATPLEQNNNGSNAIKLANTLNQTRQIKLFKEYGFSQKAKAGESIKNKISAFKQQIKKSASLYKNWPVINVASLLGETDSVTYLLQQNSDRTQVDSEQFTALHRAASAGQLNIVSLLLKSGYAINARNHKNQTALYLAAQQGHLKVVHYLLKQHADSSLLSHNKSSALLIALANQHFKTASLIAQYEKNQGIIQQASFSAIKQKQTQLSLDLLKKLDHINVLDKQKRSLLWHSADKNLFKVSLFLIQQKQTQLDQADQNGFTPLAQAIKKQASKTAIILINHGANIHSLTKQRNSLLMLAATNNNKQLTNILIQKQIALDQKNNLGESALMLAAKSGHNDIITSLIKAGANLSQRNNNDKNAYQIALESGHKDSAAIIKANSGHLFKLFN